MLSALRWEAETTEIGRQPAPPEPARGVDVGYRIGIDVGGTFTDLVYVDPTDAIKVVKAPTTPENQAEGVLSALRTMALDERRDLRELLGETDLIVHGTTVSTNTMLEFNGALTGLIATRGFRDDIEIRRGYKERIFDPRHPAPVPIAHRRHRLTVNERIDREGGVVTPLDEAEVVRVVRKLREAGVESIGVCLFFGFINPQHERQIGALIRREHPDAFVSLSHAVLPEIREFERVSTTLVNAYTGPKLVRYLESLERELGQAGFRGDFFVMLSNGGIMTADYAGTHAVFNLLSGPAGGVVACCQLVGELCEEPDMITLDMGGTSCDVSLIRSGKPTISTDHWVSRYRVAVPMLDIHTIGAGGGSIAWVDSGGALHVGPRSAGAAPGPACYGRGGVEPTLADAHLALGFLDPEAFLGGRMKLDPAAAMAAIEAKVARPLNLDPIRAASGIFRIANNNMCNAIRVVSVHRGYDPRDFVLVAFGGNGALHAGIQAQEMGIRKVIVPRIATAFSARGLLNSNLVISKIRTYRAHSDDYDLDRMNLLLRSMREETERDLPASNRRNPAFTGDVIHSYQMDMHYKGETHEITVPIPSDHGRIGAEHLEGAVKAFHSAHEALHTFANPADRVHFMNLRLELSLPLRRPPTPALASSDEDPSQALRTRRSVLFDPEAGFTETPIYDGSRARCGNVFGGPCIIEEPATTVVVWPNQLARLTEGDHYELELE
jgi:N-methylhydantoinase A